MWILAVVYEKTADEQGYKMIQMATIVGVAYLAGWIFAVVKMHRDLKADPFWGLRPIPAAMTFAIAWPLYLPKGWIVAVVVGAATACVIQFAGGF